MKRLVCGFVLLSSIGLGSLWAADGFDGTWKLNVAKSKFAKGHEIKEETIVVAEQGDNRAVTTKGTTGDGKPISFKYTSPIAGGSLTYTEGAPAAGAGATVVLRIGANTADSTTTLNGKVVGTSHTLLSADGKTLTRTDTFVGADGKSSQSVLIENRQ